MHSNKYKQAYIWSNSYDTPFCENIVKIFAAGVWSINSLVQCLIHGINTFDWSKSLKQKIWFSNIMSVLFSVKTNVNRIMNSQWEYCFVEKKNQFMHQTWNSRACIANGSFPYLWLSIKIKIGCKWYSASRGEENISRCKNRWGLPISHPSA